MIGCNATQSPCPPAVPPGPRALRALDPGVSRPVCAAPITQPAPSVRGRPRPGRLRARCSRVGDVHPPRCSNAFGMLRRYAPIAVRPRVPVIGAAPAARLRRIATDLRSAASRLAASPSGSPGKRPSTIPYPIPAPPAGSVRIPAQPAFPAESTRPPEKRPSMMPYKRRSRFALCDRTRRNPGLLPVTLQRNVTRPTFRAHYAPVRVPSARLSRRPAPDHGTCCIPPCGRARSAPGATWSMMSNGLNPATRSASSPPAAGRCHARATVAAGAAPCCPR